MPWYTHKSRLTLSFASTDMLKWPGGKRRFLVHAWAFRSYEDHSWMGGFRLFGIEVEWA